MDAIALVVPAFRIPSTKLMSIYERTREIGLITTMGATNRGAMSVYLAKARPIGLVHGLGGVLIQSGPGFFIAVIAGIYLAAHATQTGAAPAEISITYTSLWFPVFVLPFSILGGIVSGIYPAVRAASLSPIAVLNVE